MIRTILHAPRWWQRVDDGLTMEPTPAELDLWGLVCAALRIPYRFAGTRRNRALFVPALYATIARTHIRAVALESSPQSLPLPKPHTSLFPVLLVLLLLIIWHGMVRQGWFAVFTEAEPIVRAGVLDVERFTKGEWWRAVTALTLHSNSEHLFSNILFGAPFFILLCRHAGVSTGLFLAVFSGALGNVLNVVYRLIQHETWHTSLGFSTALFGIVGALSGLLATDEAVQSLRLRVMTRRGFYRVFALLATGLAVLALLGSDPSARTDYAAHIFGLLSGVVLGIVAGVLHWALHGLQQLTVHIHKVLIFSTVVLVLGSWFMALYK